MSDPLDLVRHDHPPVVEVVFGVLFEELASLRTPQIGRYWAAIEGDFPEWSEQPPLGPVVEVFGARKGASWSVSTVPPVPRVWFESADQHEIIQIQPNRFHYNLRRKLDEPYLGYKEARGRFLARWSQFREFVAASSGEEIVPTQFELAYVNLIPSGTGWNALSDLGEVFPDHAWRRQKRFLPEPESVDLRKTFRLPENKGRLHVHIASGTTDEDAPILQAQLTARGYAPEAAQEVERWFDLGHEWIVCGFDDLVSDTMSAHWGRR